MPLSLKPWTDAVAAVERRLLPGECLLCEAVVGADDPLVCRVCRARWRRLEEPQCRRCGQPLDPGIECRLCLDWPPGFGPVQSAVWLDGSARRAVHLLKYEGWHRLAAALAAAVAPMLGGRPAAVIVPIPLGAARLASRGYNQSAKLAEQLGRSTGLRVASGLLRRSRETTTQTALTPEARDANVRGAFAAGRSPAHVVLVDDVFTTGATLAAAAGALLAAGARQVEAVTFARAERPLDGLVRTL